MTNILLCEDDEQLRNLFTIVLTKNTRCRVIAAADGEEGLEIVSRGKTDLVITDVMMPKMDGYALVAAMRALRLDIPVLMITALGDRLDKRAGFRAGVDDYMVKPVDLEEMVWRVEALLRRSGADPEKKIVIGSTEIEADARTVSFGPTRQELTNKEFLILSKLARSLGRTFTREQILNEVWSLEGGDEHTLEVHISQLRAKLKDNPDFRIETVRGLGYRAVRR